MPLIQSLREVAEFSCSATGLQAGKPVCSVSYSKAVRRVLRQGKTLEQLRAEEEKVVDPDKAAAISAAIAVIQTLTNNAVTSVIAGKISPRLRRGGKEFKLRVRGLRREVKYNNRSFTVADL